jgi:hypothetical protein
MEKTQRMGIEKKTTENLKMKNGIRRTNHER